VLKKKFTNNTVVNTLKASGSSGFNFCKFFGNLAIAAPQLFAIVTGLNIFKEFKLDN
jgi:hypothetical protein